MADEKELISCPACGKLMHKVFISKQNIYLDVCLDGCGGIYFDNREYQKCDEQHENIDELILALRNKDFISVDENEIRICPSCGAKMVKNYSSIKKEIQVDDCYSCGGKFLDKDELFKIRAEYKTDKERAKDVLNSLYDSEYNDDLKENREIGHFARLDVTNADRLAMFIRNFI